MKLKLTGLLLLAALFSFGQITKNQEWIFEKKVTFDDSVRITTGAAAGSVLTSDSRGIGTWQASSAGVIQSVTVSVSSAQILQLHTTPVTIVPAGGSGTVIVPISMTVEYTFVSAQYATDATALFTYGPGSWFSLGGALAQTNNTFYMRNLQQNVGVSGSNTYANQPFQLTTPTSNPTAGDGTLKITMLYSVVNL